MRRSLREALVGFSLLAGVAGGLGLWLWLKGVSLSRSNWTVTASFSDASGLSERSPVSFRGVVVGTVRHIQVTAEAVRAELEIHDSQLLLARPVIAQVGSSSLLGGDAQVTLISGGGAIPPGSAGPTQRGCDNKRLLCANGLVKGVTAASLTSVTESVQKMLDTADREQLVPKLVAATASFEGTARQAEKLAKDGQVFLDKATTLADSLNNSAGRINPILSEVHTASVNVAQASRHINNVTAALDNPRTLADLQATLSNAKKLTDRWSAVGGDVRKLTDDPQFMNGIRNVSVGLGRFFHELYPAATTPIPAASPLPGQPPAQGRSSVSAQPTGSGSSAVARNGSVTGR